MPSIETFTITEEHLKLLRRAYIGWDDCEFGAATIDCKRPYGNSYVYGDMARILGIKGENPDDSTEFSKEQIAYMNKLHREIRTVLQIAVVVGYFKCGTYQTAQPYDMRSWEPI